MWVYREKRSHNDERLKSVSSPRIKNSNCFCTSNLWVMGTWNSGQLELERSKTTYQPGRGAKDAKIHQPISIVRQHNASIYFFFIVDGADQAVGKASPKAIWCLDFSHRITSSGWSQLHISKPHLINLVSTLLGLKAERRQTSQTSLEIHTRRGRYFEEKEQF